MSHHGENSHMLFDLIFPRHTLAEASYDCTVRVEHIT